jgi:hypothetical protein
MRWRFNIRPTACDSHRKVHARLGRTSRSGGQLMSIAWVTRVAIVSLAVASSGPFMLDTTTLQGQKQEGITAKGGVTAAQAEAGKWQPDAVLTYLESKTALPDGRAYSWLYGFDSPRAGKQAGVLVDDKGQASLWEAGTVYKTPLGEFVDSDRAMAEAIKNGLKTHDFGMTVSLRASDRAEWRFLDKESFYYVDGGTGRFLRKEKAD